MNYLLDTNILLEAVFRQEKAARVNSFLEACNKHGQGLLISSFTLDSIGVMMLRRKLAADLMKFLNDVVENITVVSLDTDDLKQLVAIVVPKYGLDFDDGYQYTCAKKYGLELVSFDKDFDKTDIKRLEP